MGFLCIFYALRTYKVVFSRQSPLIWAHGYIFKMAAGGGNEVLEESIEQQLSRIVKGQLLSKSFYLNSVYLKEAIIFLADVRSGSLDLVTFVEELG